MHKAIIQLLESGKALCARNFPLFVDAWNWLIQSFAGLRGDYDLDPSVGYIKVDWRLGTPVIRLARGMSSKSSGSSANVYPSCYEIATEDDDVHQAGELYNCYYIAGGQIMSGTGGNVNNYTNKFICLKWNPGSGAGGIEDFDTIQEIIDEQRDNGTLLIPLYRIGQKESGADIPEVLVDFRNIQHVDIWSVYP